MQYFNRTPFSSLQKTKKLVIFGDGHFAEVAYECFLHDSGYEVAGFAVERAHRRKETMFGLPVVDAETVEAHFLPAVHEAFVAISFSQLNRLRKRLMQIAEMKGYALASYISSHAFVWPNVKLGKHCFVFENNVVQPFVRIGDNVVLWSGNHIGHHTTIHDHVFISSHVVISGVSEVGAYCFIGVNTSIANNVTVGENCFINLATAVTRSLEANKMYRGQPAKAYDEDTRAFYKLCD